MKAISVRSRYNNIKNFWGEIVECIISHPNFNPSCISSDVVKVLNPKLNKKYFSKNSNGDFC